MESPSTGGFKFFVGKGRINLALNKAGMDFQGVEFAWLSRGISFVYGPQGDMRIDKVPLASTLILKDDEQVSIGNSLTRGIQF